ncbi:unnamed protein product, partial [Cyprideis torosa]
MVDHAEEQAMEMEALQSIYPDEIEVLDMHPHPRFQITLKTPTFDDAPDGRSDFVTGASVTIAFVLTPQYPEEVPSMEVTELDGPFHQEENVEEDLIKHLEEM